MRHAAAVSNDRANAFGNPFADALDKLLPKAMDAPSPGFENRQVLPARSLEAVWEEAAVDLARGAFLMGLLRAASRWCAARSMREPMQSCYTCWSMLRNREA